MNIKNNSIKIITPFFNPGEFIDNCVASLMSQKYDNYKVIFINDASDDGIDYMSKMPIGNPKAHVIFNAIRKTALENITDAIMNHCKPDDIVVLVDGDDWLASKKTLATVNQMYNDNPDKWFIYGSSIWTNGAPCCAREYTEDEFKNLRSKHIQFKVSHLRTFRAGLYQAIAGQDPDWSCMKDSNGDWYRMSYDTCMCYPLLEMAGHEHTMYNPKPLYVYNRDNPISEDRVDQQWQWNVHEEVRQKPTFNKIDNYATVTTL